MPKRRAEPAPTRVRLEHRKRFCELALDDTTLVVRSGEVGAAGKTTRERFTTAKQAAAAYKRTLAAKQATGYKEADTRPAVRAGNAELEAAITATPDDDHAYLVYGDWLQAHDDPRGELCALQAALARAPRPKQPAKVRGRGWGVELHQDILRFADDPLGELLAVQHWAPDKRPAKVTALRRQIRDHIARHADELLGPVLAPHVEHLELAWQHGWVHTAWLDAWYPDEASSDAPSAAILDGILASPACRFLRALRFRQTVTDYSPLYERFLHRLAKDVPPTLRTLVIGDFRFEPGYRSMGTEMSWIGIGNLAPLVKKLGALTTLIIQGGTTRSEQPLKLGALHLPALRHFELRSGGLDRASIRAVCKAHWPKLERLALWFGDPDYGAQGRLADITSILAGDGLGNLRHFGLCNSTFADELCAALPRAKILRRLATLDLSMGVLTDDGAAHLLRHRDAFAHLERLDLSACFVTAEMQRRLGDLCRDVRMERQRDPNEYEHRYVAIGE